MNLRETIAQALWEADDSATESRWGFVDNKQRGHYHHQADAILNLSGHKVVALPEPLSYPLDEHEWEFAAQAGDGYVNLNEGRIEINVGGEDCLTVIEGEFPNRELAYAAGVALIAASIHGADE